MGIECVYSFWDLFKKANGREATEKEKLSFFALSQEERNTLVRTWAANAMWETDERIGTDGLTYVAFAPSFTPNK